MVSPRTQQLPQHWLIYTGKSSTSLPLTDLSLIRQSDPVVVMMVLAEEMMCLTWPDIAHKK